MLPAFTGNAKEQIRDNTIHHSLYGFFSIRKEKWKLTDRLGSGGFSSPMEIKPVEGKASGSLYDMEKDINETKNLIAAYHEKAAELKAALKKIILDGRSTPGAIQEK
jgi:hypothetical protein